MIKNGLRYGSYDINGIQSNIPNQAITVLNLENAKDADEPNLNFGTNILEITETNPEKLIDEKYRKSKIKEIRQIIRSNHDKLCFFGIKGLQSTFRINKERNEFLTRFQMDCGFKSIKVFFGYTKHILDDFEYFRKIIQSKEKTFVACVDEKLQSKIFELIYLKCLENNDEIISFFGRRKNPGNVDNFNFIASRPTDQILRFSSSISKTRQDKANSIIRHIDGFDCFSFSKKNPNGTRFGRLVALDGLYFNTLSADTKLVCVITKENLYESSQKFRKNQNYEYLPIYIHDMVRLNELLKILNIKYTHKQLKKLLAD